jgi:uncharacterized protein YgiB involved in biofilm formation
MSAAARSRARWKSSAVDLRLLGTAGSLVTLLAGCSNATHHRNVYKGVEDCAADYTTSTCQSSGSQLTDRFLGPVYRMVRGRPSSCNSQDPGAGLLATRRIGVEQVVRGGFACRRSSSSRSSYRNNSGYRWSSGG